MPATGATPLAVMPAACGPQHKVQAQYPLHTLSACGNSFVNSFRGVESFVAGVYDLVGAIINEFEIFGAIVGFIAVNVVNMFVLCKDSPQLLAHNQPMLQYITITIRKGMPMIFNSNITLRRCVFMSVP